MGRSAKTDRSSAAAKQTRDPEATKAQILDAAEEEFARFGLNGARTEAIAAKTGVTKAMIYYYFGSKEALYQAVLSRPFDDFKTIFEQLPLETLPAEEALITLINTGIDYEVAHPYQQMILFQEANQNQGKFFREVGLQSVFAGIVQILERGMADGTFRQLDPWFTAIQIGGVVSFYFTTYENMKHITPTADFRDPAMVERHRKEAIAFILAGVKATSKSNCHAAQ